MQSIKVDKGQLLGILRKNRDIHRSIFLEALEGYKKQAIQLLEQRLHQLRTGQVISVTIALPEPLDRTKDYDRVIKMLEMEITPTIDLLESDFSAYVMDDWTWKRQFVLSNSPYSVTASRIQPAD